VSLAAIFSALYAVLVYLFAPVSFYALQFRLAGILRPSIAKRWSLAVGYALGVLIGNLFSPFISSYELIFMPIMSLLAGCLGYTVARRFDGNYFVAGSIIATVIPISVSWMLFQLFHLPVPVSLPSLFISEQIICVIGAIMFRAIEARYPYWWK
jgi:uncharacterized membrane protein